MTYTKPAAVYRMLQVYLGDERFRAGMRRYYEQNKLRHVTLADFQRAMEEASGEDLDWFFDQWIHTTATLDYGIRSAQVWQIGDEWVARVEVVRNGDAFMPVELRVGAETRTLHTREPTQVVYFRLRERPTEAVLDPDQVLLDIDDDNDRAEF